MFRKIIGVVVGYVIFVFTSLAFFKISGQKPHDDPTFTFILITAICGAIYSFAAGFVTQLIAKTKNININFVLALIIAAFAAFSFLKSEGNHWTQLLAIFILAPSSVLGGWYLLKKKKK